MLVLVAARYGGAVEEDAMTTEYPPLHVPARTIPVPASISPEAQAMLAAAGGIAGASDYPALDDHDGWREMIAESDAQIAAMMAPRAEGARATTEEIDVDGVRVYRLTPDGTGPHDRRVYLDIHGGALIMGGGDVCRMMALASMRNVDAVTWSVDYRMPPDHPYPAAVDDCLTAYRALLDQRSPGEIVVGGGSAGGNLAAALMFRARDEGLPMPAALVLSTPELDLTESGDSFQANLGVDTILRRSLMPANLLYADGHDLAHPYLSPLFGDVSKGFPPTIITAGTRDLFLSNAVRMHRKLRNAGIEAELHVVEAAPHGGFFGAAPEDAELGDEIRRFVDRHWPAA